MPTTLQQYTLKQLEQVSMPKGQAFQSMTDAGDSFDYALPQGWLNNLAKLAETFNPAISYSLILATTVWTYPESKPRTCCTEVGQLIFAYMSLTSDEYEQLKQSV